MCNLWYYGTWNEAQDENLGFMSVKFYPLATLSSIKHSADTVKDMRDPVAHAQGWESWAKVLQRKTKEQIKVGIHRGVTKKTQEAIVVHKKHLRDR